MPSLFAQSELWDLIEKVEKGDRLDSKDGLRLLKSKDILALGYMANLVRERKNGKRTYYIILDQKVIPDPQAAELFYGQQDLPEEQIEHLLNLRAQQDSTKAYLAFSPIPFYSKGKNTNPKETIDVGTTTGFEDLRILAGARILLDNFEHIKTSWMMLGPKLAQVSLAFGVDDLESSGVINKRTLIDMIQKAGREPVERDTLYRVL